jgi:hypothetical protein
MRAANELLVAALGYVEMLPVIYISMKTAFLGSF